MLAIHVRSGSFSDRWVEYCEINKVPFRVVNCLDSDIIDQLRGCNALLWHRSHQNLAEMRIAIPLLQSLELMGCRVFPNVKTSWHFDDKLGQKYLFEAAGIPHPKSYAFFSREEALNWASITQYPIVFKLARGSASMNVILIRDRAHAEWVIRKSFGAGWKNRHRIHALQERVWGFKRDRTLKSLVGIGKGAGRFVVPHPTHRHQGVERGYVYFQTFVPQNDHDIRVMVVGNRAFAVKRMVRGDDFRASSSGLLIFDRDQIPVESVRVAFDALRALEAQCLAFDLVCHDGRWEIVEVSYGFNTAYWNCPGYWDSDLDWHEGPFVAEDFMIEDLMKTL